MNQHLAEIQQQLDRYQSETEKVIKEFGDERSMAYFSDRFGPDHPMSARADHGVRIRHQLRQMQTRIQEFAEQLQRDFSF